MRSAGSDAARSALSGRLALTAALLAIVGGCHAGDANAPNEPRTPNIVWQAAVPALGPPALDANSMYFALRNNRFAALDRATGAVRWTAASEQGGSLTIQATPVRAADVVVFGDWSLYAFDAATGAPRWKLGQPDASGPGVGVYQFQTDGTAIFAGSVIGSAFALDAATGRQLWRTDLLAGADNEVRVKAVSNGRVYLCLKYNGPFYSGRVYALDAATGVVVWTYEFTAPPGLLNATWDAVLGNDAAGNSVLVASFYDGRVVGLNAQTGAVQWTVPRLATVTSTGQADDARWLTVSAGVVVATALASSNNPDLITGYDLATGAQRWQARSDQGSASFTPPASDAELAYITFTNGIIGAYDLSTGQRRWLREAPVGHFDGSPLVAGDMYFLGAWDAAYAIRR